MYAELRSSCSGLRAALPYARRSRDPLKSYVFICLAEAYSLCAPNDSQVKRAAFALLDAVGEALRSSKGHEPLPEGEGLAVAINQPADYSGCSQAPQ